MKKEQEMIYYQSSTETIPCIYGIRDLVTIQKPGFCYDRYCAAFHYFWGNWYIREEDLQERKKLRSKIWQIRGVVRHASLATLVFWVSDGKHNLLFDSKAFRMVIPRHHITNKCQHVETLNKLSTTQSYSKWLNYGRFEAKTKLL